MTGFFIERKKTINKLLWVLNIDIENLIIMFIHYDDRQTPRNPSHPISHQFKREKLAKIYQKKIQKANYILINHTQLNNLVIFCQASFLGQSCHAGSAQADCQTGENLIYLLVLFKLNY